MRIIIEGKPIPWKRPGQTKGGVRYDTQKTHKCAVMWVIKDQFRRVPIEGSVKMTIYFFMPVPRSWSKKKRLETVGEYHKIKPDLDNLEKFYKDCMSGIVYKDDAQVALVVKSKRYAEKPRTEIIIEEIT
jgi:Holliday junction resolvase RusA-like endonuclease